MRRDLFLIVWLLLVWILLWGEPTVGNFVSGAIVVTALLVGFPLARRPRTGVLRPLRAIHFLGFFIVKLVQATTIVAWEIITPGSRINQGVICIEALGASDALVTLVANFITLTPGTLTLEVRDDPKRLFVHVLHLHDIEAVRRDVQELEALAIRAFGSPQAIAALHDNQQGVGR